MLVVGVASVSLWRYLLDIGHAPPAIVFGTIAIGLLLVICSWANAICLKEVRRLRTSKALLPDPGRGGGNHDRR